MPHSSGEVTSWLEGLLFLLLKLEKNDSIRVDLEVKRTSLWFSINKGLFLAIHTWSHNGTIIRKTSGKRPSMYFFPSAETSQRQAFAIKLSGFNRYQHQNHSTLKYKTFMYNYAYKKKCSLWGAIWSKSDKQQESFLFEVWKEKKWKFPRSLPPPSGPNDPQNIHLQRPEVGRQVLTIWDTHSSPLLERMTFLRNVFHYLLYWCSIHLHH